MINNHVKTQQYCISINNTFLANKVTLTSAAGPLLAANPPREFLVRIDRVHPTEAVLTRGSLLAASPSDLVT
jgi:hypothetical protein